jgi:hypothetical protein
LKEIEEISHNKVVEINSLQSILGEKDELTKSLLDQIEKEKKRSKFLVEASTYNTSDIHLEKFFLCDIFNVTDFKYKKFLCKQI